MSRPSIRAFRNVSPMSSVTSTDGSSFRAWHFFVVLTLLAATAAVLTSRIVTPEHFILLSLVICAAGGAALAIYRTLLPFAGRDARLSSETLGHRARAALEREKLLVLRAIKDLEFDRAMNKLAPNDFEEMSARLKLRALRLMQQLDGDAVAPRERLERELAERLRDGAASRTSSPLSARPLAAGVVSAHAGGANAASDSAEDANIDSDSITSTSVATAGPARGAAGEGLGTICAECGASNDEDARFCKACGTR